MPMTRAAAMVDARDTDKLLEADEDEEDEEDEEVLPPSDGARPSWRRAVAGAAIAAGVVAASAWALVAHRQRAAELTLANLRKPFTLYGGDLPMPARADKYDGIPDARPVGIVDTNGNANVFVLGDWGATLPSHITYASDGGWDAKVQVSVANAMKGRAEWAKPSYVLNVGDNFYVEGLETSCNAPPNADQGQTSAAFASGWQQIYGELAELPWLSVLGNHDYGGWRMDKGWPQQIGYSFVNHNWVMPARYYMKRMAHSAFNVDYFLIDSNVFDAKDAGDESDHNICSHHNNGGAGTCAANGGMPNIVGCKGWFWSSYKVQKGWVEEKMAASDADWKIVVTHFPCGYDGGWYKSLKARHGLDLLVTGHRHQQELWWLGTTSEYVRSLMDTNSWDASAPACVVSGGGGGIVAQKFDYADYGRDLAWYGFFHLTFNKYWMNIELVDHDGSVKGNYSISPQAPRRRPVAAPTAPPSEVPMQESACESYCGDDDNPWSKACGRTGCGGCDRCKAALLGSILRATEEAA